MLNIDEKLEEIQSLTSRYLKSLAMDFIVVLVALAYVFYQMVTLEPTNLNPFVLIAETIFSIICGLTIKTALGENGFARGYNSRIWIDQEDKYNKACNVANPFIERVDNFYQCEEIEKKRNYRISKLQGIRLKYEQWFDKDGYYIGTNEMYDALDRKQKKILNKCIKVKIYPLNLFSQYSISTDQDAKPEITDKKQRANNIAKNSISAMIIAMVGVYFMPQMKGWNWGSFIMATMQVAMWVLFGILQLYSNFNFVAQDKVSLLKRKIEQIIRFVSGCQKGMYVKSPYDKEETMFNLELEKYLLEPKKE